MKSTWHLADLVFLRRECGVAIDADTFALVLEYENRNYNFAPCDCGARSLEQHRMTCPSASIMFEPDWFERLRRIFIVAVVFLLPILAAAAPKPHEHSPQECQRLAVMYLDDETRNNTSLVEHGDVMAVCAMDVLDTALGSGKLSDDDRWMFSSFILAQQIVLNRRKITPEPSLVLARGFL
jgi:hypothetical protein